MEQQHPCDDVLDDAKPLIGYALKRLLGSGFFAASERPDLCQELIVAVLSRWPKFKPERASRIGFLTVVIKSRASKLLRERSAYLRNFKPVSLEVCGTADLEHQRHDDGLHLERALDVKMLLDTLPLDVRQVAELLLTENAAAIARGLGRTRHSLRNSIRQIGRHFDSLRKPSATEKGPTARVSPG